jgi:hypothetical protein
MTTEPGVRRRAIAVLVVAAGLLGGACSASTGGGSSASGDTEAGPPGTALADVLDDGRCAWPVRADVDTLNIAYPDTNATYWTLTYALAPGEELELTGGFADARYTSFITYGPFGGAIDVLTDRDIVPDAGATNPFAASVPPGEASSTPGTGGRYTVRVTGDDPTTPAGQADNVLAARRGDSPPPASGGAPPPTLAPGQELAPPEVLLGSGEGDPDAVEGNLIYRAYLSADPDDPAGGGLPEVALVGADGRRTVVPTCERTRPSARAEALTANNGAPTGRPAPAQPVFLRPQATAANLFPNPDNVYIATIAAHRPGVVAVLQGIAPTTPDPAGGRPIGSGEQLRYWSICTNEYRKPYPVSHCLADREIVLGQDRTYTIVVSTREDRPATATAERGVTWLEWGSTEVDNLILLRHMLADPTFDQSAIAVPPGTLAGDTMGPFAPTGHYCSNAAFDSDGAACPPI